MEIPFNAVTQYLYCPGFRKPGRTLHQDMPITEQRHQHTIEKSRLSNDEGGQMCFKGSELFL
jgi:hypothetical protein